MSAVRSYAGVGSRETPADVLQVMTRFARHMESRGYILRSGGAPGADTAFEDGASESAREIYLPWPAFNGRSSPFERPSVAAIKLGMRYHPMLAALPQDWETRDWTQDTAQGRKLSEEQRKKFNEEKRKKIRTLTKLMGRNCHQVLGRSLDDKVSFLICWTQDAADGTTIPTSDKSGGTGQAIRIAADHGVRVYNLKDAQVMADVMRKIGS